MSVHVIYYKDGAKMMRPVHSRPEYLALRNSGEQLFNVAAIRQGNTGLKGKLVQMNYSCLPNADGTLKGATQASNTVGMDIDFVAPKELSADEQQAWLAERMAGVPELVLAKREALGLLMLERSASKGYHLVFRRRPELSQEENLRWASDLLGVAYDKGAKDITRVFFTTTASEEDLIWLEDGIFEDDTQSPKETASSLQGRAGGESSENESSEGESFKGIPYSSIIAEWFRRTGGEPQTGERNVRLHRLAAHLRYITDNNEAQLLAVMPRFGLSEEEMRGLIHSACSARFNTMPKLMQKIIGDLTTKEAVTEHSTLAGAAPEMPKRLPRLIKLLISRTPDLYKPAVSHAVFPALGAHLCRTRFRYIDNVEHEATLMNVLMAGTGAGKDCISGPINHIMADIRRRDAENLAREKAWKNEVNRKGANKDKSQRPDGLVIQEIDADMTGPAFVMRMAEADEHFLYTKLNEIDQFDALRGNGRSGQQFQIMCLSFDPDNRYGQTRVGTQSVTEKVCIRFNWNASTTVLKGQRYFRNVLTDGPISRINFCTIPEREIGAEMPVYGTYDAAYDEELRPYIECLTKAHGTIDCPQAYRLAMKLKEECADFARLSQSRTYENLSFRALVIAWLKACVLFVAHNYKWDKTIEDFVRWSLHYDLWCKMRFFGEAIEQANGGASSATHKGPRNLLELLPNEFTLEDAVRIRREQGLPAQGTQDMIRVWRNRGYIKARTNEQLNSYLKLKYLNE